MEGRDEMRGRTVGEFVLRERIGEGGFGAVYRCEQPLLGREAVIKVLHHRLRANEVLLQRFMREAQLASKLDHPYAAHVYAFGVEKSDGLCWIAMEMVQGTTLDRWIAKHGAFPVAELVPFFERVAEVVQTAHEHKIIHRDLKPSNIMVIERAGRLLPKLLDFGIAKLVDDTRPASPAPAIGAAPAIARAKRNSVVPDAATLPPESDRKPSEVKTLPPTDSINPRISLDDPLTHADAALGSPPYMSPEQWSDAPSVGARADLYALGIVAYEALAGRRPFTAASLAGYVELHCYAEVPPIGDEFPAALDPFFRRALAKAPADRPATALELAAEFRVAAGLGTVSANVPKLDEAIRDTWLADAPQPLAESIAALEGARNVHQARDAARDVFRTLLRYLLAVALAARSQVRSERDDPALLELLRLLHRRDLVDDERVRLLRLLVRPFATRRGAHPLPELVDFLTPNPDDATDVLDPVLALRPTSDSGGSEDVVRSQTAQLVGALSRLLRAAAFVLDYVLVVPESGAAERWTGLRRKKRSLANVGDGALDDRHPVLVDRNGRAAVLVWPLIQVVAPTNGAELELFVFDGRGRHGARLTSAPTGFEHHDATLLDWLGDHVVGEHGALGESTDDERAPYLGLASFAESDADRFVGREREIELFTNRLRQRALQVVVGASGAGKSSFVHAGVIPALPPGWRVITIRPGASPIASLATRLATAGVSSADLRPVLDASPAAAAALVAHAAGDGAFVLVIDQLEELFTLCVDPEMRVRFANVLAAFAESGERIRVICTVRDDFLMNVEGLAALRSLLSPALFLLGNPSRDDLVRVVVEPARRAGYELSDAELANEMVGSVADRPGALALLSFTASRLWDLRDRRLRQLTRKAYEAMGGVGGALGRHAEDTLAAMTPDEHKLSREAFRHLVTADGTRAVLGVTELKQRLASERANAVLDKLVAARLLAVADNADGDAQIEIMHEALIAAWPRLQTWVREDADGARMREQLRTAAHQWSERERQRGLLWRDDALAELERWRRRAGVALTDVETAFADASRAVATRGRRVRRGVLAGAFVVLGATALVMFQLRRDASDQSRLATEHAAESERRLVTSYLDHARTKLLDGRRWEALANLVEAQKLGASGPVVDTMRALARAPARAIQFRIVANHGRTWGVRYSPDGGLLATAGEDGAALWDAKSGQLRARLMGHAGVVRDAVFDPAGKRIATIGFDGTVRIFDLAGKALQVIHAHEDAVRCVAWRDDARWLVTTGDDGFVHVWDPATGAQQFAVATDDKSAATVCEFNHRVAIAATRNGQLLVIDPDARTSQQLGHHDDWVRSVQFDATGDRLVSASSDRSVRIWDVASRREVVALHGASDLLISASFSPDGKEVVGVGRDATVRVWNVATGAPRLALTGHQGTIWYAEYSRDGKRLVTSADDGSARVWDATTGMPLAVLEGHSAPVLRARFSPDGTRVATSSYDGTVTVWDPAASYVVSQSPPEDPGCTILKSTDGRWLTSGCPGHTTVWDTREHRAAARIELGDSTDPIAAANATNALILNEKRARLVASPSGQLLSELDLSARPVDSSNVAAAPDRLGIADASGDVRIVFPDGRQTSHKFVGVPRALALLPDDVWIVVTEAALTLYRGSALVWTKAFAERFGEDFGGLESPSGKWFVLVGLKELWLHALGTSTMTPLEGHQASTLDATFDRSGARIISTSQDGTAIIWDVEHARLEHRLISKAQYLASAVFDDSDHVIVALDGAGALQLFDADNGGAIGSIDGRMIQPKFLRRAADGMLMAIGEHDNAVVVRIPRDTGSIADAERDLACKAPPNETVGTCTP